MAIAYGIETKVKYILLLKMMSAYFLFSLSGPTYPLHIKFVFSRINPVLVRLISNFKLKTLTVLLNLLFYNIFIFI